MALVALALAARVDAARERTGHLDAFLVLDESGSMKPIFSRLTAFVAEAVVRDYLEPDDYLCVIGFSDQPRVRISQRLSSSAEKENLARIVRDLNVVPQGYTDMGRALEEAQRQLEALGRPSSQQVVLILTDGLNQPPRDSPYFSPLVPDRGTGLAPPSSFNERFLEQVKQLAARGFRIHVVGIGTETDARRLAEALGTGHTVLRQFDPGELRAALAGFWDETVNLAGVDVPSPSCLPGQQLALRVRIVSTSPRDGEVQLRGARLTALTLAAGAGAPDPSSITVSMPSLQWPAPSRREAAYDVGIALPPSIPAGDYRGTIAFDQESAVRFYPGEAEFAFHVPSLWERHGRAIVAAFVLALAAVVAGLAWVRRPVPVRMVVEGDPAADGAKPVRLRIHASCTIGGGAADRLRIPGLPQKVAVLERRTTDRFALISSRPEIVPTVPEYALGDPIEVKTGGAPEDRRVVRFVRWTAAAGQRTRPRPPAPRPAPDASAGGAVDFR
jgi:Mg-chelatase subunit ChlD